MGRKKTRALIGHGFERNQKQSRVLLGSSFLGRGVSAGRLVNAGGSLVFLADLFNQTAGYEVLELFVGAEAEHLFATTHRIADFQVGENALKEIVEAKYFFVSKDIAELIGDMIGETT